MLGPFVMALSWVYGIMKLLFPPVGRGFFFLDQCWPKMDPKKPPYETSDGDAMSRSVLIGFNSCVRPDDANIRSTSYDQYSEARSTISHANLTCSCGLLSMHGPWGFLPNVGERLHRPVLPL
jgi:hypothetical protein